MAWDPAQCDFIIPFGRDCYRSRILMSNRPKEQLAEEAGLAKPIVRNRVPELAESVIANLANVEIAHPVAAAVAALMRKRCENVRDGFRN